MGSTSQPLFMLFSRAIATTRRDSTLRVKTVHYKKRVLGHVKHLYHCIYQIETRPHLPPTAARQRVRSAAAPSLAA
eukprot:scaffold87808_cov75-Phaeocystis_antarctica.AAC.3